MQIGMIGLGRMGANMVRRLLRGGQQCVVYDRSSEAVAELVEAGLVGAHAVGRPVDGDDGGVVQEAVEDGGGDGGVGQHGAPVGDAAVGGEHDRAVFVAA